MIIDLHIFLHYGYVGWSCVLNPYLVFLLFADLLSLHLITFLSCCVQAAIG